MKNNTASCIEMPLSLCIPNACARAWKRGQQLVSPVNNEYGAGKGKNDDRMSCFFCNSKRKVNGICPVPCMRFRSF